MIIVWGVHYLNKQEKQVETSVCEHCSKQARIESYSAAKWGHLYWIPLIPWGKKYVHRMCSKCKQGYIYSYKDWVAVKSQALLTLAARYGSDSGNPEFAAEALQILDQYGNSDQYMNVSEEIEHNLPHERDLHTTIALWHLRKGDKGKAASIYQQFWGESASQYQNEPVNADSLHYTFGFQFASRGDLRNALNAYMRIQNPSFDREFHKMNNLGTRLEKAKRPVEAHALYVHLYNLFTQKLSKNKPFLKKIRKIEARDDLQLENRLGI